MAGSASNISFIFFLFLFFVTRILSQIPRLQKCMWRDQIKYECEIETELNCIL